MSLTKNIKGFVFASTLPTISLVVFQILNYFFSSLLDSYAYWYWGNILLISIFVYISSIFFGIPALLFLKIFRIKNVLWYGLFGIMVGLFSTVYGFIPNVLSFSYLDFIAKVYLLKNLFFIGGLMGAMSGFCYWYIAVAEDYSDCS